MTNIEKQADEIVALQSIFDKKFRLLDENQYEILIEFDLIDQFIIEYNNKTSIIKYLPPLTLIIHYHDEYPNDSPPSFVLSCFYFSKYHLGKICQKLDNYLFIKDEVCIYDWIELIKNEINNKFCFSTTIQEQINDPRALNGYTNENVEKIFQYLIDYNSKCEKEHFENQLQICLICTNIIPGKDFICLYRCTHFYCRLCLNNYVKMTLENGLFGEKLHCPQNQCKQSLLPTEVKHILQNDQLYERYERLTLQYGLELMDDILWCPRCQSAVLSGIGDDKLCVCDKCHYAFCKKCKEIFHSQTMCHKDYLIEQMKLIQQKEFEQIELQKQEKLKQVQEKERILLSQIMKAKEKERPLLEQKPPTQEYNQVIIKLSEQNAILEEVLTAEKIDSLATERCPKCCIHIEKDGGCSHMYCSRCHHHFTWGTRGGNKLKNFVPLLTKNIENSVGLDTLKDELHKVTHIVKMSEDNDEAYSNKIEEKQNEEELKISFDNQSTIGYAIINRIKQCPNKFCQKNNVKIAQDNWIICSACMKQYCFLCGATFHGTRHFEKKCLRYTPV